MPGSGERIYYLLQAYVHGRATEVEENELFQWVALAQDDGLLKSYIQNLFQEESGSGESREEDWEEIYRQIQQRIKEQEQPHLRIRLMLWRKIAAAVLVMIIGGAGYYWMFHNRTKVHPSSSIVAEQHFKHDILPGGEKAILKAGNVQVSIGKKDTNFILGGNPLRIAADGLMNGGTKPVEYTLITPRGGEYRLVLSDGTKVWLNADSKLIYPSVFATNDRKVFLEGEAYFEVAKDAVHPFIVNTLKQEIRVLGTAFNVHAYLGEPKTITTLVSGKVEVKTTDKTLILKQGQQAAVNQQGELSLQPDPDIEQSVAWKEGYFRFDRADIQTIMFQLSRWYDVEVSYSPGLQPHYFGAIISRDNNISGILNMLEATGEVHFKVEGKKVIVMP